MCVCVCVCVCMGTYIVRCLFLKHFFKQYHTIRSGLLATDYPASCHLSGDPTVMYHGGRLFIWTKRTAGRVGGVAAVPVAWAHRHVWASVAIRTPDCCITQTAWAQHQPQVHSAFRGILMQPEYTPLRPQVHFVARGRSQTLCHIARSAPTSGL